MQISTKSNLHKPKGGPFGLKSDAHIRDNITIPEAASTPRLSASPTRLPIPTNPQTREYGREKRRSQLPPRPVSISSVQALKLPSKEELGGEGGESQKRNASFHGRNASTSMLPPSRSVASRQTEGERSARTLRAPQRIINTTSSASKTSSRASRTQGGSAVTREGEAEKKIQGDRRNGSILPPPVPSSTAGIGRLQPLKSAPSSTATRMATLRSHVRNLSTNTTTGTAGASEITENESLGEYGSGIAMPLSLPPLAKGDEHTGSINASKLRIPASSSLQQRPAFTTYQQHFSPKKSMQTKPPSITLIKPPAKPAAPSDATIHPELFRLQTQLLHLHALHSSFTPNFNSWTASARQSLGQRFSRLAIVHRDILASEKEVRQHQNLQALRTWSSTTTSSSSAFTANLSENAQRLSTLLRDLLLLTDEEGKYETLTRDFAAWIASAGAILPTDPDHMHITSTATPEAHNEAARNSLLVLPLLTLSQTPAPSWSRDHAALTRKLASLTRDAEALQIPPSPPSSTLAELVRSCKDLVRGMAEELQTMSEVQKLVVEAQRRWVDERVSALEEAGDLDDDSIPLLPEGAEQGWRKA